MKAKQILAIAGIVLLGGLYLTSLIFALIDHPLKSSLLTASLYCTIVIPVLLYVFLVIAKHFKKDDEDSSDLG